jgi:hypothetical protein
VKGQVLLCWGVFDELLAVSNLEEGTKFSLDLNLINAMRKCSKIVGRIHGKAVGVA